MKKRVGMKDIAAEVGVSIALVSYVMNNKGNRVAAETDKKIRAAAERLNYRPNQIARSLQSGRSQTLGLIVADISNPFFSQIARIIEDEAARLGYTVIFGSSDESVDKSRQLIEVFINRQVDALIVAPAEFTEVQIKALQKRNIPVVLIDRYFPGLKVPTVRIDNYAAAYKAVSHLIARGRRRIAMVTYNTQMPHILERIRGWKDALRDQGIQQKEGWLIRASYQRMAREIETGMTVLLQKGKAADAFFFATNSLAIEGLRQINHGGLRVPDQVAVVSFDQGEAFDLFYSPITYVSQPLEELGRNAVKLALDRIAGKSKNPEPVILAARLVVRDSSGKPLIN